MADAETRVRADVESLGWVARYRVLEDGEPTATQCALWDRDGAEIPYGLGSGKGPSAPARVGAQYEALEHALSGPLALEHLPLRLRSAGELLQSPLEADRAVREIAKQPDASVACLPYTALDGGSDLDIPLYVWATWYVSAEQTMSQRRAQLGDDTDPLPVRPYCGSTGCAIGATYDEAVLHAVNEWAERDALSLFLLRTVYDGGPMCGRLDAERLPEALSDPLERARTTLGRPVVLLDLTTDLGIPVVMAYSPGAPGDPAGSYGMGASLSPATAVERAVAEIVQGELLTAVVRDRDSVPRVRSNGARPSSQAHPTFDQLVAEHDIASAVRQRLRAHPRLLACAQLDVGERLAEAPPTDLADESLPVGAGVREQWRTAVKRINAAGHRVLATTLRTLPHGTTLVQVQCPGLERFHMITKGHLALPGARGVRRRFREGRTAS